MKDKKEYNLDLSFFNETTTSSHIYRDVIKVIQNQSYNFRNGNVDKIYKYCKRNGFSNDVYLLIKFYIYTK